MPSGEMAGHHLDDRPFQGLDDETIAIPVPEHVQRAVLGSVSAMQSHRIENVRFPIRMGPFGLAIEKSASHETVHGENNALMSDRSEYQIRMCNVDFVRCIVSIKIDGRLHGTFLLGAGGQVTIKLPSAADSQFKFFMEKDKGQSSALRFPECKPTEATAVLESSGDMGDGERDLIQCEFTPEQRYTVVVVEPCSENWKVVHAGPEAIGADFLLALLDPAQRGGLESEGWLETVGQPNSAWKLCDKRGDRIEQDDFIREKVDPGELVQVRRRNLTADHRPRADTLSAIELGAPSIFVETPDGKLIDIRAALTADTVATVQARQGVPLGDGTHVTADIKTHANAGGATLQGRSEREFRDVSLASLGLKPHTSQTQTVAVRLVTALSMFAGEGCDEQVGAGGGCDEQIEVGTRGGCDEQIEVGTRGGCDEQIEVGAGGGSREVDAAADKWQERKQRRLVSGSSDGKGAHS